MVSHTAPSLLLTNDDGVVVSGWTTIVAFGTDNTLRTGAVPPVRE